MQDMLEPEDLFNPRHYDSVRRRFDVGRDPAGLVLHLRRNSTSANATASSSSSGTASATRAACPNIGSYITFNFCGVPLIVVRGEDRELRAFINSCPHRGSEIMAGEGTCRVIEVPRTMPGRSS